MIRKSYGGHRDHAIEKPQDPKQKCFGSFFMHKKLRFFLLFRVREPIRANMYLKKRLDYFNPLCNNEFNRAKRFARNDGKERKRC